MKCQTCGEEISLLDNQPSNQKDNAIVCPHCGNATIIQPIEINDLKEIMEKNFEGSWEDFEIILSVPATLLLEDISNPVGLILEGPPSSNKTTYLSLFYGHESVHNCDDFTPKAFISHAANISEKQKREIDLLPKIKDKMFIVPELAPLFNKRKEDLVENLGILTRVFDGEGLSTNSGLGARKYEGEYLFAFCGATTPISKTVWDSLGKLGNRWLTLSMKTKEKDNDYIVETVMGKTPFKEKIKECKPAVHNFLTNLINKHGGLYTVEWDRENDNKEVQKKIASLTQLVVRLRAPVQVWKEREDTNAKEQYSFTSPIIEEPERLTTLMYTLARGHALVYDRERLEEEDWRVVLRVGLGTMPYERGRLFKILLKHRGVLDSDTIQKEINCSQSTASRIMTQLEILGIVEKVTAGNSGVLKTGIALNKEFDWILRESLDFGD